MKSSYEDKKYLLLKYWLHFSQNKNDTTNFSCYSSDWS